MRPGASHLYLAAALALAASGAVSAAVAAPRPGAGAGPASYGGRLTSPPRLGPARRALGVRPGFVALGGERHHVFLRRRAGLRPFGRFGLGYGAFYGLPYGYADGCGFCGYEDAAPAEALLTGKPEWPTTIGIPPSPIAPPALYVIGSERRAGAASGRRAAGVSVKSGIPAGSGSAGRVASGPVFIPVPSAR